MTLFDKIREVEPLAHGALSVIGMFYPAAVPIINLIEAYEPAIVAALPAAQAAAEAGGAALDAAQAASPQFKQLIDRLWTHMPTTEKPSGLDKEGIARAVLGIGRMTPEQEAKWMDDATPMTDKDSRFGGG